MDIHVCSLGGPKLFSHVTLNEAVSFNVQDPLDGDSARGQYTGTMKGAVRPLLDWE